MNEISITKYGSVTETISIAGFQSASLVLHTKRLSQMANEEISKLDKTCLIKATILMGAAALEAILLDTAYLEKAKLYSDEDGFLNTGFRTKIRRLKGKRVLKLCDDAQRLWDYRIALVHSEPTNERTLQIGEILNEEGAKWVHKTLEDFVRIIWESEIPSWFSETTGITNHK